QPSASAKLSYPGPCPTDLSTSEDLHGTLDPGHASFYQRMAVGAKQHALPGLGPRALERSGPPRGTEAERFLRRIEVVKVQSRWVLSEPATSARPPGLVDQYRLDTSTSSRN